MNDATTSGARAPDERRILVEAGDDSRLDVFVASHLDISRNQAATLITNGHVLVSDRPEKASYRVEEGDVVFVSVPPARVRDILAEDIPLVIVFEDDDILVVNKPAGMVVHPAPGNWSGTLVNALMGRGGPLATGGATDERAGLVHRLDKETSGLLIVAKTDRAHRVLGAALSARRIARRYAAMLWGHLREERLTIERPIARDPRDRQRMAIVNTGRAARTDFVRLARFDSADLVRAHLHTGRTHQIRVHAASIGHPVVGDDTYGGGGGRRLLKLPTKRHFLHAAWLRFQHPVTGEAMDLRAPLPPELRISVAAAAGESEAADQIDPLETYGFFDDPLLPSREPVADPGDDDGE